MGKLLESLGELETSGVIGDWCFHQAPDRLILFLRYPVDDKTWKEFYQDDPGRDRGEIVGIPVSGDKQKHPVWQWDGNRDAPTLSPSINVVGRWHGFFRAGKLIGC